MQGRRVVRTTLKEAMTLYRQRDEQGRNQRQSLFEGIRAALSHMDGFSNNTLLASLPDMIKDQDRLDPGRAEFHQPVIPIRYDNGGGGFRLT